MTDIAFSLFEPAMDRRRAGLKLSRQLLGAAPVLGQRNDLLPEFRVLGIGTLSFESQNVSIKPGELQSTTAAPIDWSL